MRTVTALASILKQRLSARGLVAIVRERLGFDPQRVLRWAFAQGVLSAVWRVADGRDPERGLATANAILPML